MFIFYISFNIRPSAAHGHKQISVSVYMSTAKVDEFVQFKLETKKGVKESEIDANV
jgi:hypothetical protein